MYAMFWHYNLFGGMLMIVLQLALDFTNLHDAIEVAKKARDYIDWIEAGTPLIKSCGMSSILALKKEFPGKKVVADMKIMDTGALEVKLAADAGADVITVMAAADLSTVKEAITEGRRLGKIVVVDTIGAEPTKIEEIECMAPDYICPHVGIDQQRRGVKLEDVVRKTKMNIPMAVGGGINSKTAGSFVRAGAKVIIVGNAITRAKDVRGEAKSVRDAIDSAERAL
jgi:3-hexulose-6-phosphate synthase/6-phospho-3-hexuloisomerase